MSKIRWQCLAAIGGLVLAAQPAAAIRVVSYNLLLYPGTTGPDRNPSFQEIITHLQPDVVMAAEVSDATGASQFLNNVLNVVQPGEWVQHAYFDCGDRDQCLFYRSTVLQRFGIGTPDDAKTIGSSPRLTPRWRLRPIGYTHSSNVFYVYGAHLKSSEMPEDVTDRANACALIRADGNAFPPNTRFLVTGDMNFYTSAELGYFNLTTADVDNDGRVADPLNPNLFTQNWSGQFAYRFMHSQSPRISNPPNQGGGVLGGLDDRFDFIFPSTVLMGTSGISYIAGSYRTVGQDGSHYNLAVNNPLPNGNVPDSVANALWNASDHIPVLVELNSPARLQLTPSSLDFGTAIVGATVTRTLTVENTAPVPGEALTYQYFAIGAMNFTPPGGMHSDAAGGGNNSDVVSMNTATAGVKSQTPAINMTTNARETQVVPINATGTVLDHGQPSTQAASVVLAGVVDFGGHPVGGFSPQPAVVHNAQFNPLQAELEVWEHVIGGPDAGRFSVPAFAPAMAGASPASFDVVFDSAGAADCTTYSATLTLRTRDRQDLPGATALADVVYSLTARVGAAVAQPGDMNGSGGVECGDIALFVQALVDPGSVTPLQLATADMNGDCVANGTDVQGFEAALSCP